MNDNKFRLRSSCRLGAVGLDTEACLAHKYHYLLNMYKRDKWK